MTHFQVGLSCIASFLVLPFAHAEVRLPNLFSDHAVLQRDRPIHLWGWADPGEPITLQLHKQTATVTADSDGHWSTSLAPEPAGGPFELVVRGHNTIVLEDILIGDVFVASGQSNMGYPLTGIGDSVIPDSKQVIAAATRPNLRLLHVPKTSALYPQHDQAEKWTRCEPSTAAPFSALAYFFGVDISEREHVPVGIILAPFGGMPAEAFISLDTLSASPKLLPLMTYWSALADSQEMLPPSKRKLANVDPTTARPGEAETAALRYPALDVWRPAGLYNAMISPLAGYAIKGVLWYQGESSAQSERADLYAETMQALIADWREQWRQGDFPFLYLQISSYTAGPRQQWGEVRDAQRRNLNVANTAMVVTLDLGDPANVHPNRKREVADRLVLAARGVFYGEKIEYSGPLFREASADNGSLRVWFDHAEGLAAKGDTLKSFELAGADRNFIPATALVDHDSVLVRSDKVAQPRYVRYAWSNATEGNLYNGAGLPASTFTSAPMRPLPSHP